MTPEENLSPNEFLMPERVLVNNEFEQRTEKKQDDHANLTVDSQYVIDKLEEAEMQEK